MLQSVQCYEGAPNQQFNMGHNELAKDTKSHSLPSGEPHNRAKSGTLEKTKAQPIGKNSS
jgi:hypothetical protein